MIITYNIHHPWVICHCWFPLTKRQNHEQYVQLNNLQWILWGLDFTTILQTTADLALFSSIRCMHIPQKDVVWQIEHKASASYVSYANQLLIRAVRLWLEGERSLCLMQWPPLLIPCHLAAKVQNHCTDELSSCSEERYRIHQQDGHSLEWRRGWEASSAPRAPWCWGSAACSDAPTEDWHSQPGVEPGCNVLWT